MNTATIFSMSPGSRMLLQCENENPEAMIKSLCTSVPESFSLRARLNSSGIISMEILGDDLPNSFHDLAVLCSRLIAVAGRTNHFKGLLLLNVTSLLTPCPDIDRLQALGEVLSVPDGPASECVTVLYGETTEQGFLLAANSLDFDGELIIDRFEFPDRDFSVRAALENHHFPCASETVVQFLENTVKELQSAGNPDLLKLFRSCAAADGSITEESIRSTLKNPYSYINRMKNAKPAHPARRIGFGDYDK